ncbi:DMT family transporter [Undibacterium sp. Ji22W]|uniref:DMT family transporter n=1 Tax=Undibacterium sp. Ji22W TaxID=3413038 RepID=UPI003BF2CE22
MRSKLSLHTIILLTIPPMLWSANAIVGRLIYHDIPPVTLNFLRWLCAFAILLPFAYPIFRANSSLWRDAKQYAYLGLLGIGLYNALQYAALQSSGPINVTLVASGMPVWMMLVGLLFFGAKIRSQQIVGAALSIIGVLFVLSRGKLEHLLGLHLVAGDLLMIAATIAWSFYSWLLADQNRFQELRPRWTFFLMAQISFGLLWSGLFTVGELTLIQYQIVWSWKLIAAIIFVAIGPALIAFRCWGAGVQQAGPNIAGFFVNLTPLFTTVLSAAILGELPDWYHGVAFALIVAGIIISSQQRTISTAPRDATST